VGGKRPKKSMSTPTLGQGPSPKKNPSSAMGRTLLGMDVGEDQGGSLPLVMTLQIIPRNSKKTRVEKDSGKWKFQKEKLS